MFSSGSEAGLLMILGFLYMKNRKEVLGSRLFPVLLTLVQQLQEH
jgi:hypothetical protein